MATVIRDAVIRIGLQQIPTELKAPDVSSIVAGQDKIAQAAEKARKAVSSFGPAQEHIAASNERIRSKLAAMEERRAAAFATRIRDKQEAERRASEDTARLLTVTEAANRQALESFQQLGTGVFQVGRGIAFFAASTEDDLRKFLNVIAQVQGGFDVFRGGTTAVLGMQHAMLALEKATKAQTAAQVGLNAAFAGNPIGLAVVGITTALGLGAVAWAAWGDSAETAAQKASALAERERAAQELSVSHLRERLALARQLSRESPGDTAQERLGALSQIDPRMLESQMRLAEQRQAEARREALRVQAMSLGAFATTEATGTRDVPGQQREAVRRARALEVAAAQRHFDIATALGERERAINEEKINSLKATHAATAEQLRAQEQLIGARQRELDVVHATLAAEREKVQSIAAQLGALNKGEQAELRRLAQRHAAGEQLTAQQAQRLGGLGGNLTRDIAQGQLANLGRDFAQELAKTLGINPNAGVAAAQERQRQAEFQLGQATGGKGSAEALAELARDQSTLLRELKTSVDALREVSNGHIEMTRELATKLFRLEQDHANAAL